MQGVSPAYSIQGLQGSRKQASPPAWRMQHLQGVQKGRLASTVHSTARLASTTARLHRAQYSTTRMQGEPTQSPPRLHRGLRHRACSLQTASLYVVACSLQATTCYVAVATRYVFVAACSTLRS